MVTVTILITMNSNSTGDMEAPVEPVISTESADLMASEEDEFVCNEDIRLPSESDNESEISPSSTPSYLSPSKKSVAALLLAGGCCGAAALALQLARPSSPPLSFPSFLSSSPPFDGGNGGLLALLDLNQRAACGRHKCFYRAKEDATKGYLVATRTHIEELDKGWNYANCLEQTYGILHYMNAGPFTSHLSEDMASTLNEISFSFSDEIEPPQFIEENVVVQEVTPAEEPHMLIGCNKKKRHFLQSSYFDQFVGQISNKKKFLKTLDKNVRTMFDTIRSEPALMDDFQVILQQDGSFHYLDFSDSNADWAAGAPFNTTTFRNNINSCEKMVRPVYEKFGATEKQLKELDEYLDGIYYQVKSHVGQNLRAKDVKKKNACLHHLLSGPQDNNADEMTEVKVYLSKS